MTLVSFIVSSIAPIFSVVSVRPVIFLVLDVVPPASVILRLILVQEMRRERSLIPHASYLFLGEVSSVLISGPIAWAGLLFFFAMVVNALALVPAMVVCRPCHVDIEREL